MTLWQNQFLEKFIELRNRLIKVSVMLKFKSVRISNVTIQTYTSNIIYLDT